MSDPFPLIPLGKVVSQRKEFIEIDDTETYKRCRVQLHAAGIVLRDIVAGLDIKTKQQQVCRAGEFLVAEIDAKVGGFGIVPDELEGAIVSSHYFLFTINEAKLDRRFLGYYVRTPAFRDQVAAQGSTNYAAIRPHHVLEYTIPLPPLAEQRRIVARIEALAARIEMATGLRAEAVAELGNLSANALTSVLASRDPKWTQETVSDVIASIDAGWSPRCEDRPAHDSEWGVLKTTSVQWRSFRPNENKCLPAAYAPLPAFAVQAGDVLVTRAGPRKRVGVVAAVRESHPRLMISDKLIRLRLDRSRMLPEFLELSLCSPLAQDYLVRRKTGLADAQVNISQEILLSTPVSYPTIAEQRRIVAYLDEVQAKADALSRLQAETEAELDALLPALLDRAFRGEL